MGCSNTKTTNKPYNIMNNGISNQLELISKDNINQKKLHTTKIIKLSSNQRIKAVQNFNKHIEEALNNNIVFYDNLSLDHEIYMDLLTAISKNENLISFTLINSTFNNGI